MRPLVLNLEGFSSFRDPTTIDLGDADYFVLVGPTGSGKSSLIDAVGFALYGSVPRYEDRRLVAPVISQGKVEARVGLEFALGADRYRAVRVVRQTGKGRGATTKEARLERIVDGGDDEVLAGDADGVSREVERLLGLSFDHFTKCVVLPQGAFASFLHDKPADRQELLVELLDLGVYSRIAAAAHSAGQAAAANAASLEGLLTRPPMASATPAALASARARVAALDELAALVAAAQPELDRLALAVADADRAAHEAAARLTVLARVRAPADVATLGAEIAAARVAETASADALAVYDKEALVAEEALGRLPARSLSEAAVAAHVELAGVEERLERGRPTVADLAVDATRAAAEVDNARTRVEAAVAARDAAFVGDQARALARHLVAGQPCPVCEQTVAVLPSAPPPPDLEAAEALAAKADAALARAQTASREASDQLAKGEALLAQLAAHRDEIIAGLQWASADEARAELAAVVGAEQRLVAARSAERDARAVARRATDRCQALAEAESAARSGFDRCRDLVASLGPPPPGRKDLAADWASLEGWAASAISDCTQQRTVAEQQKTAARQALDHAGSELARACAAAGVVVADAGAASGGTAGGGAARGGAAGGRTASGGSAVEARGGRGARVGEAVAAARSTAVAESHAIEAAAAEAERVRSEIRDASEQAAVARSLSQHLNASHFEKWLLDEALALLVDGASRVLGDLSGDGYSLTLDGTGGFAVIDHRNADLARSARTLSGGETFLASLALALSLADRLGELAAEGSARLESIFLDEGFGTLDADTLDVVASAIEALASNGRVVGLVTHVRDLADRVPVRFEVSKDNRSSRVERVEV